MLWTYSQPGSLPDGRSSGVSCWSAAALVLALGRLLPEGGFSPFRARRALRASLFGTSAALVGACEVVFVRDIFHDRMNTVFKLYYQAWLLLGLGSVQHCCCSSSAARRWLVVAMVARPYR